MVVHPYNADAVINFVQGYEYGTKNACNFTQLSKKLLSEKYKIQSSSDGWCGQIGRLADKNAQSWIFTFKQITLEIISNESNGVLSDYDKESFIINTSTLIDQIDRTLYDGWVERWLDVAAVDTYFPNQLWSSAQLEIINLISQEIKSNNIYADPAKKTPSSQLTALMLRFKSIDTASEK